MSINFLSNLIIIFKQDIRLSMLHCVFLLCFFWFYKFCIVSLKGIWKKIVHSCKYLHSEPELQKHKSEIACLKSNQCVPICVSRHIYEWICRYICLRFSFLSCKQYPLSPLWFLHIIISFTGGIPTQAYHGNFIHYVHFHHIWMKRVKSFFS